MTEPQDLLARLTGRAGLQKLWATLPQARLVGGCVRDLLHGSVPNDLDIATPEPPDTVFATLSAAGIRVVPTGLSHGTVTALVDHEPFEVTTLRRDEKTDGRHAVVAWTDSWEEDAARRDFTINAMSLDRSGKLHDYFSGRDDLAAGRVRFVGEAGRRIEEDALRALRFFRFDARYGCGVPDRAACDAISDRLDLIGRLSAERVASEMLRILVGPRVVSTLNAMRMVGLLERIVPGGQPEALESLLATGAAVDPLLRLFALAPKQAADLGRRLKLSNADKATLAALAGDAPLLHPGLDDDDLRRACVAQRRCWLLLRSWLGQACAVGRPDAAWDELRARLSVMPQPEFPLGGREAMACGVAAGPEMGAWLAQARAWWIEQGCTADAEACLEWMRQTWRGRAFRSSPAPC